MFTGPVKVPLQLETLKAGREPQVPYSVDRQIQGGAGGAVVVPGSESVLEFTRMGEEVFVVLSVNQTTSELLKLKITGDRERVPGVLTVRGTADQSAVAYSTQPRGKDGLNFPGASSTRRPRRNDQAAHRPRCVGAPGARLPQRDRLLPGAASDGAASWKLYAWKPGEKASKLVSTPGSPTAISNDGKLVALRTAPGEIRACSTVNELATGRSLWRTCEYEVRASPPTARRDRHQAVRRRLGQRLVRRARRPERDLLREWTGAFFVSAVAEDDHHVLMLIDDKETMPRGILRCTITTGACESAVPLGGKRLDLTR